MLARRIKQTGMLTCFLLISGWLLSLPGAGAADPDPGAKPALPKAFDKPAPENLEDLLAIQNHVRKVLKKAIPSTVGVRAGAGQGSGVIINKEGHVLTAGHISGTAGREVDIILFDGRKVKGKTLGSNQDIDSGLLQITEKGPWPFAQMGKSADLKMGQWCLAVGHPGGIRPGRTPVVRLGRVLDHGQRLVRSDCTIVGGDSGGPLFDMEGKVIGIHSRIGQPLTANIHVPVDTFRESWERLAKGEVWGERVPGKFAGAYLGLHLDPEAKNCRVREVAAGSPADKAGLKVNDVLLMFDGKKINTNQEFLGLLRQKKPGNLVEVQILRGSETITLKLVLGKRPV